MLTVLKKGPDGSWGGSQWQPSLRKALQITGPPSWLDRCLRSYSPSSLKRLFIAVRGAHRLKDTDGEVIIRGNYRSMAAMGVDAAFEALGVNDYMRCREVIEKWPRLYRFLLKHDYI